MNLAFDPEPVGARHVHLFSNFMVGVTNLNGWDTMPERPGFDGNLQRVMCMRLRCFGATICLWGVWSSIIFMILPKCNLPSTGRGVMAARLPAIVRLTRSRGSAFCMTVSGQKFILFQWVLVSWSGYSTTLISLRWPLSWGICAIIATADQLIGRPWVILVTGLMICQ